MKKTPTPFKGYPPFVGVGNFLSDGELNLLSSYLGSLKTEEAMIYGSDGSSIIKQEFRRTQVAFFSHNEQTSFLYSKLVKAISEINAAHYQFDLYGITEDLQYTVYRADHGGHYDWHIDMIVNGTTLPRKLSVVYQFSNPGEYEGGELHINYSGDQNDPVKVPKMQNFLVVFPSYMPHKVTPVTDGIRKTIVIWINGSKFK
jgi:PKHD-type hydroxylase